MRRLKAEYPAEGWALVQTNHFQNGWLGRTRAWEALLEEWEDGQLSEVQPRGDGVFPFGGLRKANLWSVLRGETRQHELVGMTTEAELPAEGWGDRMLPSQTPQLNRSN
eukprot:SAG31_NODE_5798_length_2323_cov_2.450540_1_plen_109_part_00